MEKFGAAAFFFLIFLTDMSLGDRDAKASLHGYITREGHAIITANLTLSRLQAQSVVHSSYLAKSLQERERTNFRNVLFDNVHTHHCTHKGGGN